MVRALSQLMNGTEYFFRKHIMPILRLFIEMKGRILGLSYKMLWVRMHTKCAKEVCFTPISISTLSHYKLC
jgi:hypothetical protein